MRNILFISPQFLFPIQDGGKKCVYYHMKMFEQNYLMSFVMGNVDVINKNLIKNYLSSNDYLLFPRNNYQISKCNVFLKAYELAKWFFSGLPRRAQTIYSKKNKNKVMEYISQKKIEVVILTEPFSSEFINLEMLKEKEIKIVVIAHNVEYFFFQECWEKKNKVLLYEVQRIKSYEKNVLRKSDLIIALSPFDKEKLKNDFCLSQIVYLPTYYPKAEKQWVGKMKKYIIFSGSLSFYPNYHGMKWFVDNVFSKYIQSYPEIKLVITGNVKKEIQDEFANHNIEFVGYLSEDELSEMLLNCMFEIIPVLKGSGIKIKLLEALSYGIPVIATMHAYQGIPFKEQESPYLVSKDENDFYQNMINLTENQEECKAMGERGKNFFERVYASEENRKEWMQSIEDLVGNKDQYKDAL